MDVHEMLSKKLIECSDLMQTGQNALTEVAGKYKLIKKICTELKFLTKLKNNPNNLTKEHVKSSNIPQLSALLECCLKSHNVVKILETFYFGDINGLSACVVVDVISDHGGLWTKVVARNPNALKELALGQGKFRQRTIIEQAKKLIECASQNEYLFEAPKIRIWFAAGITQELKKCLETLKIEIFVPSAEPEMRRTTVMHQIESKHNNGNDALLAKTTVGKCADNKKFLDVCELSLPTIPRGTTINLDVTALIAQVSNVTNGHSSAIFNVKFLAEQAERERISPVRPVFDEIFKDCRLICCETAHKKFMKILSVVGGEREKLRSKDFLSKITIVADDPSQRSLKLDSSCQLKDDTKNIFGTGDSLKIITLSANIGFLRSSYSQGVKYSVFVHEPRALTEQKEIRSSDVNL